MLCHNVSHGMKIWICTWTFLCKHNHIWGDCELQLCYLSTCSGVKLCTNTPDDHTWCHHLCDLTNADGEHLFIWSALNTYCLDTHVCEHLCVRSNVLWACLPNGISCHICDIYALPQYVVAYVCIMLLCFWVEVHSQVSYKQICHAIAQHEHSILLWC